MNLGRWFALLLVVAVVACGGRARDPSTAGAAPDDTPGPGGAASLTAGCGQAFDPGSSVRKIDSDGLTRTYRLYVPVSYAPSQPTAVVLNFHGFAGESLGQEWYANIPGAAEKHGFLGVTPDGSLDPQRWHIAAERLPTYVDDFAFVRRLLDELSSSLCVDANRVYAMGISNGGFFSSHLACEMGDRIAAVATVAGELFPQFRCLGKAPASIVAFHGTDDAVVPFEGRIRVQSTLGLPIGATRDNMRQWAEFDGCALTPRGERLANDVLFESYAGCSAGADVHLYVVEGGGHSWPGAADVPILGHTTQSINATDLAWRFFAAHPRRN